MDTERRREKDCATNTRRKQRPKNTEALGKSENTTRSNATTKTIRKNEHETNMVIYKKNAHQQAKQKERTPET